MSESKELVIDVETGEIRYELISQIREPVDIEGRPFGSSVQTSRIRRYTPTVRRARYVTVPDPYQPKSPRQDATSTSKVGQGPKTRGGTDEFISAYWVKGKPKCRRGYRYDFKRKMCVKKS